jgi:hypothetical protein
MQQRALALTVTEAQTADWQQQTTVIGHFMRQVVDHLLCLAPPGCIFLLAVAVVLLKMVTVEKQDLQV